jgi:shikimate dehydrogenase
VYGFLEAGIRDVRVFNRSVDRSAALAHHFGGRVSAHAWDRSAAHIPSASVIVNTTTLGMKGNPDLHLDLTAAKPECVVADLVYVPLETPLLRSARAQGLKTVDGLGMLLHQAVPGFEKWFGIRPDVTDDLRSLVAADIEAAR